MSVVRPVPRACASPVSVIVTTVVSADAHLIGRSRTSRPRASSARAISGCDAPSMSRSSVSCAIATERTRWKTEMREPAKCSRTVAPTVAVPAPRPITMPDESTVTTAESSVLQMIVAPERVAPCASMTVTARCIVSPTARIVSSAGVTTTRRAARSAKLSPPNAGPNPRLRAFAMSPKIAPIAATTDSIHLPAVEMCRTWRIWMGVFFGVLGGMGSIRD